MVFFPGLWVTWCHVSIGSDNDSEESEGSGSEEGEGAVAGAACTEANGIVL